MKYIVGIDEAGRGPLAGPLVVSGVLVKDMGVLDELDGVRDSKEMTDAARRRVVGKLDTYKKAGTLVTRTARTEPSDIDRLGIAQAAKQAVARVLPFLAREPDETLILLDGSLYAPSGYPHRQTIAAGDASEPAIALASIIAKVTRDDLMDSCAKKYPAYGFEKHKGYGTKAHRRAIEQYGPCKLHRRSFIKIANS